MNDRDALWLVTQPDAPRIDAAPNTIELDVVGSVSVDPTPVALDRRPTRRRRRSRRWLLAIVGLLVVYFVANFAQVWWVARADEARPVDAIVVLGAAQYDGRPSPQLAARLDHAADLYTLGLAPTVVVTGGNRPGDRFTEASASARYLAAHGVPAEAILQENQGHSTWESMRSVAALLADTGAKRVLIVTDPYHTLRTRMIAEEVGFTASTSPTRTSPVRGASALLHEAKEAAGVSVGRIIGFRRLWQLTG